jgi:dihydropteroate synthase
MVIFQGILNITPDSFSDGIKYLKLENALKQAETLINDGAKIIDIGGESSGPGSKDVSLEEELNRVVPVVKAVKEKWPKIKISVDTYKSEVAKKVILNGVEIINDITAGRADKNMAKVIAGSDTQIIIMYSKNNSARTTIDKKDYQDVIKTIIDFFEERIKYFNDAGVENKNVILDPGLGHFISSDPQYSFEIIDRIKELKTHFKNHKILLGISRKSFLGGEIEERDKKGLPVHLRAAQNGVDIFRVHTLKPYLQYKPLDEFLRGNN